MTELIKRSKLIIWDEAMMVNKFWFEAVDKSFRDILQLESPNILTRGGKCVVLGGDFRQLLPVIPKGNRYEILFSTINLSCLWKHYRVLN